MFEYHIRDANTDDYAAIKRLNDEFVHFTSPMDLAKIVKLHNLSVYCRVIEKSDVQTSATSIIGFLLAMASGSEYQSDNYRWFDLRYKNIVYIDRVVIDSTAQGAGLGRRFYDDLFTFGKEHQFSHVCCEYNLIPNNPISAHFHKVYGFRQVGCLASDDKNKVVSMQMIDLLNTSQN